MKKKFVLIACVTVFACACQQKTDMKMDKENGQKQMDDQNYQDRRKDMKQPQRPTGGCCEAEKIENKSEKVEIKAEKVEAPQQSETVATPEVKVEKAQS